MNKVRMVQTTTEQERALTSLTPREWRGTKMLRNFYCSRAKKKEKVIYFDNMFLMILRNECKHNCHWNRNLVFKVKSPCCSLRYYSIIRSNILLKLIYEYLITFLPKLLQVIFCHNFCKFWDFVVSTTLLELLGREQWPLTDNLRESEWVWGENQDGLYREEGSLNGNFLNAA